MVLAASAEVYRKQFIGQMMTVLWEAAEGIGPDGWHVEGLSGNYLRVNALAPHSLWNQLSQVRLVSLSETGLNGEIIIS